MIPSLLFRRALSCHSSHNTLSISAKLSRYPFHNTNSTRTPRLLQTRSMASSTCPASASQLQTLHKYTACDIADALLKLSVPNAGFLPDLHLYSPSLPPSSSPSPLPITIARASTVLFAAKTAIQTDLEIDLPGKNIPDGKHWVDLTQEGSIVVMKQPDGQKCAVLGGIMALRMSVLGAKGVVVHGRVRDLEELRGSGLPIWANSTSIVGTGAEAKPHAVQIRLDIDGTIIEPGDLVFADPANGIIVIPQNLVTKVIEMLPGLIEADDRVKEDVAKGMTVQEAFKKHRG